MDELGSCLIKWLNTNELKIKINTLDQLSDGIAFYQLLTTVSQEYFDIEGISLDIKNTWALKLGNLRRLKKNIDRYCEEELKIKVSKYDRIDLPKIARTSSPDEVLKLFEYVMLVVLNCSQKHVFIKRIMDLEECVQVQLMYFIQKVMGSDEDESQETETFKKELESLKQEKKRLSDQVSTLENELSIAHEEFANLHSSFQQLKVENERLSLDMDRKIDNEEKEIKALQMDLRSRLGDKDEQIFEMRKSIEKSKKKFEIEITQLKDDLDIANNKLVDAEKNEKMIKQYKKRLESLNTVKQKSDELEKQNEEMAKTLALYKGDIDNLLKIKAVYNVLKEQLEQEKLKCEALTFNLESKEKQIKKQEKASNKLRETAMYFKQKAEELEDMNCHQESSNLSEESVAGQLDKEFLAVHRAKQFNIAEHFDNMTKDFNRQKSLADSRKTKLAVLQERFSMFSEDVTVKIIELENINSQLSLTSQILQKENIFLCEEIQKITESLKEKENELFTHIQVVEELDSVKSSRLQLMNDYKSLVQEKEKLSKNFSETSSKMIQHKSSLTSKDSVIIDLQFKLSAAEEKIRSLKEQEELVSSQIKNVGSCESLQDLNIQTKYIKLKQELSTSLKRENQLEDRVNQVLKENQELLKDWQEKLKIAESNFESQIKKRDEDMVRQIEEATNELMKQRDLLVGKLQSERRNSLLTFKRTMSNKELPLPNGKEVVKLREMLLGKEKEISKLKRSNKELKVCWKQTAKILKAVSKELGCETVKIEGMVKEREQIKLN